MANKSHVTRYIRTKNVRHPVCENAGILCADLTTIVFRRFSETAESGAQKCPRSVGLMSVRILKSNGGFCLFS